MLVVGLEGMTPYGVASECPPHLPTEGQGACEPGSYVNPNPSPSPNPSPNPNQVRALATLTLTLTLALTLALTLTRCEP